MDRVCRERFALAHRIALVVGDFVGRGDLDPTSIANGVLGPLISRASRQILLAQIAARGMALSFVSARHPYQGGQLVVHRAKSNSDRGTAHTVLYATTSDAEESLVFVTWYGQCCLEARESVRDYQNQRTRDSFNSRGPHILVFSQRAVGDWRCPAN